MDECRKSTRPENANLWNLSDHYFYGGIKENNFHVKIQLCAEA